MLQEQELHVADMVVRLLGAKEVMVHPAVATQLVDSLLQLASRLQRAELAGAHPGVLPGLQVKQTCPCLKI